MARSSELLWLGRPPGVSQLGSSDEGIAQAARALQDAAYIRLETLATRTQVLTEQLRGFSPADRQYLELLLLLKTQRQCTLRLR